MKGLKIVSSRAPFLWKQLEDFFPIEEKDKGNLRNAKSHVFSCEAVLRNHPLKNKPGWEAAERKTSKKERKRRRK